MNQFEKFTELAQWMSAQKYPFELFENEFRSISSNMINAIASKIKQEIKSGLLNDVFATWFCNEIHNREWYKQYIGLEDIFQIEQCLFENCYYWQFRQRFPRIALHMDENVTSRLVANRSSIKKISDFLSLYGHSYFLNKKPTLLRISKPANKGSKNKGRKADIPQEDMVLFVYNAEEVENEQSSYAYVCQDGKEIISFDLDKSRLRLLNRSSTIENSIESGIYSTAPPIEVRGLQPFWQHLLCEAVEEVHFSRDYNKELFLLCINRFLGDRITPWDFWAELKAYPDFTVMLEDKYLIKEIRQRMEYQHNKMVTDFVFKSLTINEN